MIDQATRDKIIDAAQIVDVVGEFVTLRKSGVNYKGLCPFHDDRNPSFMVSPSKNICHCFVCGKGGTPVSFLMEHEQITYPEALRWLARKYNIEVVEKEMTDAERQEQSERESMFVVNEWARTYFNNILKNDPEGTAIGRQYFRSRGIRDDIIEKFQLGYALQKRDALATAAQKAGYQPEFLTKTGLCIKNENGLYDRYAGRAIFPWLNVSGKVVAFGGRVLDSRTKGVAQKYVNSPDSDIYHKERELYGIFQAKKTIVKEDRVFMVEGYTDVIAMHQAGVENVVANSGTALSNYQIRLLHRFTQNITLLYDGDDAGIHAAIRGTDMLLQEGMNVKVLLLPDGDDPDSFARKHSAEELKKYIDEHQTDFIDFKTNLMLKGVEDPVKRSEAISSIVRSISVIPQQIVRDAYLTRCAQQLQMSELTLVNTMNKYIARDKEERQKERERAESRMQGQQPSAPAASQQEQNVIIPIGLHSIDEQAAQVEQLLVRNIIRHGDEVIFENVETDDGQMVNLTVAQYIDLDLSQDGLQFSKPIYNKVLEEALEHSGEEGFRCESYFTNSHDLEMSRMASEMIIDRHQLGGRFKMEMDRESLRQTVQHLILDYRYYILEARLKDLKRRLNAEPELLKEYMEVNQLLRTLAQKNGRNQ